MGPSGDRASPEEVSAIAPLPELSRSIELIRLIQAGDSRACNELLTRYRPRLLRIVRIRLGSGLQRRLDDEDIVQESLLIASERLGDFELRSHAGLLHWLARIAENVIKKKREHHDAQRRDPARELQARSTERGGLPGHELAAGDPSPSLRASRAEMEELVDAYVEALDPPEYREVILQRDYFQEEWEEVRRLLGRPTVAATQELHRRAHQRLRERLRRYLDPG